MPTPSPSTPWSGFTAADWTQFPDWGSNNRGPGWPTRLYNSDSWPVALVCIPEVHPYAKSSTRCNVPPAPGNWTCNLSRSLCLSLTLYSVVHLCHEFSTNYLIYVISYPIHVFDCVPFLWPVFQCLLKQLATLLWVCSCACSVMDVIKTSPLECYSITMETFGLLVGYPCLL